MFQWDKAKVLRAPADETLSACHYVRLPDSRGENECGVGSDVHWVQLVRDREGDLHALTAPGPRDGAYNVKAGDILTAETRALVEESIWAKGFQSLVMSDKVVAGKRLQQILNDARCRPAV